MDLPFGNESFDTIISTQVLEHVEKHWLMVKKIYRVLGNNGIYILTSSFLAPYHVDPHYYFRYTIEEIKSLFRNEDFEIIECDGYGKTFSVLSEFFHFSFFNPYKKQKIGSRRIILFVERLAKFLDKFSRNKIIHTNVFIIAKKK